VAKVIVGRGGTWSGQGHCETLAASLGGFIAGAPSARALDDLAVDDFAVVLTIGLVVRGHVPAKPPY
jgi:hypothetical protein